MEYNVVLEREASGSSKGLGLGWLLVIALGGGALLFLALGLLLAWYLKRRAAPCTTRVYSWNGIPNGNDQTRQLPRGSTHRLLKKRLLANSQSELGTSGWSSRMSLTLPVLPPVLPMPRHHSFRGRRRTRSWVNEEEMHGPAVMRRSWRESWFGTEGWFGRTPTVPDLNALENGNASGQQDEPNGQRQTASAPCTPQRRHPMGARESPQHFQRHPQAQTPTRNPSLKQPTEGRIEVQKRDSRAQHQQQQQIHVTRSAPNLAEEYRGRVRLPAQVHVRPGITDAELRDILHMTEQRLREGTSQSPNKTTPRTSPSKRSPVKTPRSYRSISRTTPSPSKKTPGAQSNGTQSRNASVSSIGSAANSLLAEAAQQLELPGGMSSPSRLKGREWSAPPQLPHTDNIQNQNTSPSALRYRTSMDSDVSSTLSTLYSAGEPEEPEGLAVRNAGGEDPFVENAERRSPSWETKQLATDARAFRRRTNVVSGTDLASSPVCSSACPSPLRPISTVDRTIANRDSMSWVRQSLVLQPPTVRQCDDVEPKANVAGAYLGGMSRQTSESSMVSVSVHTDDSDATELPVLESSAKKTKGEDTHDEDTSSSSRPATPTTPVRKRRNADMSSSPYNEEDILNLLLSSAGPKRALPLPPPRVEGADDLGPTQLSPRPRSKARAHTRPASIKSDSSSNYEQDSFADDEDTVHPVIIAPSPQTLNVTNTISELRRMNSMISSYSVASIASTTLGDLESAAIPALRGGGFSPSRSQSRASLLGKKNYLSIGDHSPKKKVVGSHQRTNSKKSLKAAEDDGPEKENKGRGLKVSRGAENGSTGTDSPNSGLRDAKRGSGQRRKALSRENSASARGSPVSRKEKKRLNPVEELAAEEKRLSRVSVDSLGLYDKDGFLVGSPEREKCLRM